MKNGAFAQSIYKQSVNQLEELDTVRVLEDGRTFAYALAGGVALAAGKFVISPAPSDNAKEETLAASAAIGDTSLYVTFGTSMVADYFKDGWIWADTGTGLGNAYRVKGHAAGSSIYVYLKEPVRVAHTAGNTTISALVNRQKGVVVSTYAQTSMICGVPQIAVTEGYYFWNQVKGPACVLVSGTLVIGNQVGQIATAGAVTPLGSSDVIGSLGVAMKVTTTASYTIVALAIPGY